jgi:serine/threonine protein kinase/tetratricopeptide (TPR) repeat protein
MPHELEDVVAAFESAQARDRQMDLSQFLPSLGHPLFGPILAELVRADLEFGWQRGRPKPLEHYQRQFPDLAEDAELWPQIAFEEYRLRRQAGENASPEDYRAQVGSVVDDWPILEKNGRLKTTDCDSKDVDESSEGSHLVDTRVLSIQPLLNPDLIRAVPTNGQENDGISAWPTMGSQEHAEELRELHKSEPAVAQRLAKALQEMPEAGSDFEGFRLVAELGRGAFGRVFLAQQKELAGRLVALKISTDLFHESQTLAQLQHTNIVPIYSAHQIDSFQALCMPYLGSTTLAELLKAFHNRDSLPVSGRDLVSTLHQRKLSTIPGNRAGIVASSVGREPRVTKNDSLITTSAQGELIALKKMEALTYVQAVLWIGARLADGLAHAHEHQIIHRDLKPANVLLADDGQPLLLDFNLSVNQSIRSTALGASLGGTLPYMAPEQLKCFLSPAAGPDARSDIYSLGLIFYELLAGKSPFPSHEGTWQQVLPRMICDRVKPAPAIGRKNVSPAVESIIRRCLEPNPERRYQSARELQEDLERQLENRPLRFAPEPSLRERARKWTRRHPRLASSTSVALIATALIAILIASLVIRGNRLARFQALENWNQFQDNMNIAKLVLYGRAPDREKLDQGLEQCRKALDRFQVLENADWNRSPEVRRLTDSEHRELQENVGELLFLTARATEAKATYDPAHPRQEEILLALHLSQSAAACYDTDKVPKALWEQQAELLQLCGKTGEASALSQKADQTPLRTAQDNYLAAQFLATKGNFRMAWPLLQEAVQADPRNFSAWFVLGNCHNALIHYGDAVACYSTCIALRPEYYWSWFNRGLAYHRLGNYGRAVADFNQTIRLKPDLADAYLHRGMAQEGLAHYDDAIRDLTTALELGAPPTQIYFLRAAVREKAKDPQGAKHDWDLGIRSKPADEQSYVARAYARQETNPKGALADYDQALAINPRCFAALENKGHILADLLKDDKEAVVVLDTAVSMFPESAMARAGRGVSRARLGEREKALADGEAALLLDPSPQYLYQVGCIYALTSKNHPEDRLRALQLISYALKAGFGLDLVDNDTDLDPLRSAPQFQRLVSAMKELHAGPESSR